MVFVYLYGHIVCVALEVARKGLASGKISADRFHANRPLLRSVSRRGASSQYASCPGKGGCTEASIYKDKLDCMGNVDAECRSGNRPFPTSFLSRASLLFRMELLFPYDKIQGLCPTAGIALVVAGEKALLCRCACGDGIL